MTILPCRYCGEPTPHLPTWDGRLECQTCGATLPRQTTPPPPE